MSPTGHVFQLYRTGGDTSVRWRLIASNGRGLARSAVHLATPALAVAAIERVVEALPDAVPAIQVDDAFRWRWSLDIDGVTAVTSAVPHDRRTRCLQACRRFVDIAATTPVDTVVLTFPDVAVRLGTISAPRVASPFVPRSSGRGLAVAEPGFDRRGAAAPAARAAVGRRRGHDGLRREDA